MGAVFSLEACYTGDLPHPVVVVRRPMLKPLNKNELYASRMVAYSTRLSDVITSESETEDEKA